MISTVVTLVYLTTMFLSFEGQKPKRKKVGKKGEWGRERRKELRTGETHRLDVSSWTLRLGVTEMFPKTAWVSVSWGFHELNSNYSSA